MIAIGVGDTRAIVAGAVMVALSLMRVLFGPSDNIREQVYREDILAIRAGVSYDVAFPTVARHLVLTAKAL